MQTRQFTHVDPIEVPRPPEGQLTWPVFWRETLNSPEMEKFIQSMRRDGQSVRDSVLDDLCTYMSCTPEEAIQRAKNWGVDGLAEWKAAEGDVLAYARETVSSVYSLLWYGYLQAEGLYYPLAAGIARAVGQRGKQHLDFGSGVGITSQVFQSLGYETTLGDVATSLLDFARFRLERRGVEATYIDLNAASLPENSYDVITALDVLCLVPDLGATMTSLHRALKPSGLLFGNFTTSVAAKDAPWHLYDDDRKPRRLIQRTGFEPVRLIDKNAGIIYRKVDPNSPMQYYRAVRDAILLGPMRGWYRAVKARTR